MALPSAILAALTAIPMLTDLRRLQGRLRYWSGALRHRSTLQRMVQLRADFYQQFWQEAAADLGAELESPGYGFLRLRLGNTRTVVRGANVMLDDHVTLEMAGNKAFTHQLLMAGDLPVPRHVAYRLGELKAVHELLEETGRIVVKPAGGCGGRGITADITEHGQLLEASCAAHAFGDSLLAEEQIAGDSYRMLYLDDQLIDAVHRGPPTVVGDGRHSLSALVQLENRRRLAAPPFTALSPLMLDPSARYFLNRAGRSLRQRPAEGEIIAIKSAVNQNASRDNRSVLGALHPSYLQLGRRISRQLPIRLLGLDVIVRRIDQPLSAATGVINELNTTPAFHHHELIANREQRVRVGSRVLAALLDGGLCGERSLA